MSVSELASESLPETGTFQSLLRQSRQYTRASNRIALWQLGSTLLVLVATLLGVYYLQGQWLQLLLVPPLVGVLVRLFVLQHDCGHLSLFRQRRWNDAVGTCLSFVSGVPYEAWRTEHNWHHNNQGKLSHRGVDRMNSPMTREEALADPAKAVVRAETIGLLNIAVLGAFSILVLRKHSKGFFFFRPNFRWEVRDPKRLVKSVWLGNAGHLLFHLVLLGLLGPRSWAMVLFPALVLAGVSGALLFWVQHNFEETYHASEEEWDYAKVGVEGSSYLRFGPVLRWCTASIGLHHVHHVNPRIPNYRLEEARRSLPPLAELAPLALTELARCFTHVYWDTQRGRLCSPAELASLAPAEAKDDECVRC